MILIPIWRSKYCIKQRLKEKFNAHIVLRSNVDFVKKFVELFDLLAEYRDMKENASEELKTFYLNEILVRCCSWPRMICYLLFSFFSNGQNKTFYGHLKRYDIYVRYVETLRQIHKACKKPVCAAYTLKLHAVLLNVIYYCAKLEIVESI